MANVSFSLPEQAWKGLNTRFRPESNYIESDQFTSGSYNFFTDFTGAIAKVPGGILYSSLSHTNNDQYEAIFSSGIRHLLEVENGTLKYSSGNGVFNSVTSGYNATANMEFTLYLNRAYFSNGVDDPQSYDLTTSYGGVTYTAPKTKKMGALVPVSAPTFAADSGTGLTGSFHYEVTFLYYDFEESNGGPASTLHTVTNKTINLTAIPIGGYGVTARKIYRDANDGNYVLVGTILDNTTTTFADSTTLGSTPIPLDNGLPPKYSLTAQHLDRIWGGGVVDDPSHLFFSQAGLPDVWSVNGNIICNSRDPISGLWVYNDRVLVFNRHSMGQVLFRDAADFRYSEITPNIGCVDNRTIQTRTIRGVPTVMWLSEFGWYEFNGSSVNAISTEIDDQLQLNIKQGVTTKGQISQTTESDFAGGTASPGIDLTSFPGNITTKSPVRTWETETDWEGGSSLMNVATISGTNDISVPTIFVVNFPDGAFSGTQLDSGTIDLPTGTNFTGETCVNSTFADTQPIAAIALPIIPPVNGNLTEFHFGPILISGGIQGLHGGIATDNGLNAPGSMLTPLSLTGVNSSGTFSFTGISVPLTGGTRYWIMLWGSRDVTGGLSDFFIGAVSYGSATFAGSFAKSHSGSVNTNTVDPTGFSYSDFINDPSGRGLNGGYTFVTTLTPTSGQYITPIWDSETNGNAVLADLISSTSYPSGTTISAVVQGTNDDPALVTPTWTTTDTISSPTGTQALTGTGYRFWQVILTFNAPTQLVTPVLSALTLKFSNVATWISEVIDHTIDIVSLDNLTPTDIIPAGTSISVQIATSTDNITYSSYSAIGSATPHRYSKVKVILTATSDDVTTPTLSNLFFSWTLTSNLISSALDTGATPAGWDIFQSAFTLNDGTISFFVRTATTSGGLGAASFVAVTNGSLITAAVNEWIQYKVVITNSTINLATVASVIINWLITLVQGTRAASIFYKKRYYMGAAEFSSATNNVVFVYDEFNTWKLIRGVTIATLGLFFNEPYYGDAATARVVKWLIGNTNVGGTSVTLDVRTKAFSKLPSQEVGVGADDVMIRWIRSLVIKIVGTGARITPTYSVDGGNSFLPMALTETGNAYYDTPNDGILHAVRFSPVGEDVSATRSILIRLFNNDAFPVSITNLKISCITSRREVLNG